MGPGPGVARVAGVPLPAFCGRCGGRLAELPGGARRAPRLSCTACGAVEYLNPRVAACTIVPCRGGILLVRRAIPPGLGRWVVPGGYVDLGETVREAAVREVLEETGVHVELERLLDAYSYPDSPVVVLVFVGRAVAGTPTAGDECLEVACFPAAGIPWDQLAFRSTREALRDYLRSTGQAPVPAPGGAGAGRS